MALPAGGLDRSLVEHSAGRVCVQALDPAVWQHHNANLVGAGGAASNSASSSASPMARVLDLMLEGHRE